MADENPIDDAPRFHPDDMPDEATGAEPVQEAYYATLSPGDLDAAAWVLSLENRTNEMADAAQRLDAAYNADRYDDALQAADDLVNAAPDKARPYVYRGMVRMQVEQIEEAVEDFNRAIEIEPENAEAYVYRGRARYAAEDTEGSIEDFKQAIRIDPDHAPAYMERGYAFFSKGAVEAALNDFKHYAKLVPNNPIGHNNQAFVALWLGRTTAAESAWRRSTMLPDAPHWAFAGHAVSLYRMKKRRQAFEQYQRAIELDPRWRDNIEEVADDYSWPPGMIATAEEIVQRMQAG